ncbi:MAG: hypothetical protein CFE36_13180 [Sphingomonadaceae bacterium PASS1]|nr:MAG: hypothetical protein CFE36_13180 [Sphingomonadaceae bacterium PASS1]
MKQRFPPVKPHLRPEGNGSASFFPLTPRWPSQDTISGFFLFPNRPLTDLQTSELKNDGLRTQKLLRIDLKKQLNKNVLERVFTSSRIHRRNTDRRNLG